MLSGGLAVAAAGCLRLRRSASLPNIARTLATITTSTPAAETPTRYACSGSPDDVADDIADEQDPGNAHGRRQGKPSTCATTTTSSRSASTATSRAAFASKALDDGYNQGQYMYLGPGFYPGSPASGSGGSPGGPDGIK